MLNMNGRAGLYIDSFMENLFLSTFGYFILQQETQIKAAAAMAKTVTKLIETGFVVRKTNKKDKRTYDVSPTDKSWGVYSFIKEQIDECFSKMTYKMTDDEREEFRRLLVIAAETTIGIDE